MGDVSKNFSRKEFSCECGCGFNCVDVELLEVLEDLREVSGGPVTITGGNRCVQHNEDVQKQYVRDYVPYSSKSQHINGIAVDIKVKNMTPSEVYRYLSLRYPDRYGVGLYDNRVHIDVRPWKARWGA